MKCTRCNQEIAKGSKFCIHCGTPVDMAQMNMTSVLKHVKTCPQCQKTFDANYVYCNNCGAMLQETVIEGAALKNSTELPMKWYKFIIYVQLFLNAFLNLINMISLLTGSHYGDRETAALVYSYYGNGLRVFDIFLAVVSLGLIVLAIMARMKLKKLKVGAPQFYLLFLILCCAFSVITILGQSLFLGELAADSSAITSLATSIALIFVNKSYFDKRANLFCN